MDEINKTNLSEQKKFQLSEIIGVGDYFDQEIYHWKWCSKILGKYVTDFDYTDKILIVLSGKSSAVCIISSVSVAGALVEIAGAWFTLFFCLATNQKITKHNNKQKEKLW